MTGLPSRTTSVVTATTEAVMPEKSMTAFRISERMLAVVSADVQDAHAYPVALRAAARCSSAW